MERTVISSDLDSGEVVAMSLGRSSAALAVLLLVVALAVLPAVIALAAVPGATTAVVAVAALAMVAGVPAAFVWALASRGGEPAPGPTERVIE